MNILKSIYQEINDNINIIVEKYSTLNPWTNVYGVSRSIIAINLLVTLIFTNHNYLFPKIGGSPIKPYNYFYEKISIFYLFQENLNIAVILSIIILLLVIIGFYPQITGFLHWWITYSYMISSVLIEGGDQIASIITLFLIPICLTDNRKNHWFKNSDTKQNPKLKLFIWSIYFIIILQISIVYFHAGIDKMKVEEWLNGTATYYWFTHSIFGVPESLRSNVAIIFSNLHISFLFTWGTILFEILLSSWIFMKRNNWNWKLLFLLLLIFHLGIALVHGLVSFMFTMIGCGILYLFPKNEHLTVFEK